MNFDLKRKGSKLMRNKVTIEKEKSMKTALSSYLSSEKSENNALKLLCRWDYYLSAVTYKWTHRSFIHSDSDFFILFTHCTVNLYFSQKLLVNQISKQCFRKCWSRTRKTSAFTWQTNTWMAKYAAAVKTTTVTFLNPQLFRPCLL